MAHHDQGHTSGITNKEIEVETRPDSKGDAEEGGRIGDGAGPHGNGRTIEEMREEKKGFLAYVKTRDFWILLVAGLVFA